MEINGYSFEWPSWYGAEAEARCFVRCFLPHENNNTITKITTLIFVTGWVGITAALTFEDVATVRPVYYGVYTAIVFLIFGRIWKLELENYVEEILK